jgi:hypothetical protein
MNFRNFLVASAVALLTLAPARAQTVFVTDFYATNSILRVDSATGTAVPPPVSSGIILPSAMAYGPDGFLYATNQAVPSASIPGSITKINPVTGAVVSTISFSNSPNPGGLAFAPNGDLYVSDFVGEFSATGSGSIQKYSITGTTASPVGSPLVTGLNNPGSLLFNGNTMYFTEVNTNTFGGGRLSKVDFSGGTPVTTLGLVTGAAGSSGFAGMALSGNTLYYTDLIGGAIDRYDVSTGTALSALVGLGGSLANDFPSGLYVDAPGSILVADLGSTSPSPNNGDLRRYSTLLTDTQIGPNILSGIAGGSIINAVPEPGTLLLVGGAAIGGLLVRRRRAGRA